MDNELNTSEKRIDEACKNFKAISNDVVNQKFDYLDTWLRKTSIKFKKENVNTENKIYPRFAYGTITKIDFGINEGSELSGPHFAITIDKYDSTKNSVITVIPLTSHYKKFNLPLNDLIIDEITKRLKKNMNQIEKDLKGLKEMIENDINVDNVKKQLSKKSNQLKSIKEMMDYYSNYANNSYACINQITTVSKSKVFRPKNEFDILGRAKCSSKTMRFISGEMMKKFTNISPDENSKIHNNKEKEKVAV